MKLKKIPYSSAEVEVIFFCAEDIVTTSNMESGGTLGTDWNTDPEPDDSDDWS